jgi:hypothetical protein
MIDSIRREDLAVLDRALQRVLKRRARLTRVRASSILSRESSGRRARESA